MIYVISVLGTASHNRQPLRARAIQKVFYRGYLIGPGHFDVLTLSSKGPSA